MFEDDEYSWACICLGLTEKWREKEIEQEREREGLIKDVAISLVTLPQQKRGPK
jgi:hypothetical protein